MQFVNLKIAYMPIIFTMEFLNRLKEVCASRGITVAEAERGAGLTQTSTAKWNRITPGIDKIIALADYFGISIDELIGRTPPEMTKSERMLFDLLDQLNDYGKGAALAMLQGLANQPEYKKGHTSEELEA